MLRPNCKHPCYATVIHSMHGNFQYKVGIASGYTRLLQRLAKPFWQKSSTERSYTERTLVIASGLERAHNLALSRVWIKASRIKPLGHADWCLRASKTIDDFRLTSFTQKPWVEFSNTFQWCRTLWSPPQPGNIPEKSAMVWFELGPLDYAATQYAKVTTMLIIVILHRSSSIIRPVKHRCGEMDTDYLNIT